MSKVLTLFTDGGSRGNPGPAASGFILLDQDGSTVHEEGKYLGITTNNVAEYTALVLGLEKALHLKAKIIEIKMDSELIVKQMKGEYRIKQPHLLEIADKVRKLLDKFEKFSFTHVRREYNKQADRMVNIALDKQLNK